MRIRTNSTYVENSLQETQQNIFFSTIQTSRWKFFIYFYVGHYMISVGRDEILSCLAGIPAVL